VDTSGEISKFLTSRRARITPVQAGLPSYGDYRRVPGLRREEVALLAGVSVDYYTRLERGNANGVSEAVLSGLARALQLDEAERAHLFDLARAGRTAPRTVRRKPQQRIRPSVQRLLDAMTVPAFVRNNRLDVLASNRLGRALYFEMGDGRSRPANTARFLFLDPRASDFYLDCERAADDVVAILHSEAGRDPYDRALSDLVGELSTQGEAFRARWATHNVRFHDTRVKRFHHPVVGELTLSFENMELSGDVGLMMFAYTPEPGSSSEEVLSQLASWAATLDDTDPCTRLTGT
jgi:transcriptional regulator with XRE-family HTH domain